MLSRRTISDGFAFLAAFSLLAVLPVAMAIANRSSAAVLGVAAGALLLAALADGPLMQQAERVLRTIWRGTFRPVTLLMLALIALALVSIPKTAHPAFNLWRLGEALVPAGLVTLMLCLLRLRAPMLQFWMPALGISLASVLMLIEFYHPGALRGIVGLREETWRLNRSVMTLVFLLPFLFVLAQTPRNRAIAAVVLLLSLFVVAQSDSASSLLAVLVMASTALLARLNWTLASRAVFAGTLVAILSAPFHGLLLSQLLPDALHERMRSASSVIRVMIYHAFDAAIAVAPVLGAGFNASTRFWDEPGYYAIPEQLRGFVQFGHPHNAAVQLWLELGLAGVVLVCAVLALAFRRLDALPPALRPHALSFWAGVTIVALVSHGAWQAWWLALIGVGLVLIASESRSESLSRERA